MAITLEKTIEALLKGKKYATLRDVLMTTNEADLAAIFSNLPEENLPLLFRLLPKDLAADTFALMDADSQELLIQGFSDNELKDVFDELYVDDAVDIVEEMPANVVKRILANTHPDTRKIINEILQYPEDSAGSLMSVEYISLRPKMTISDAIKRIRRTITNTETIYTCYVTDDNRHLLGYVSVRRLLLAEKDEIIEDIMDSPIFVRTTDDKEDVAKKMGRYDFVTMPVVDDEMRLVGIIMFDDALDVIQDETTEDIERMAAISPTEESYFKTSDFKHAKNRITWLLILMLSATITGKILNYYEAAFSALPILVGFIPMLMGTGGNCGSQSSTMIIRGMAIDQIKLKDFFKVIWLEFRVSLIISVTLAVVNGARIILMYWSNPQKMSLALVISISIVGIVIISQFIGCSLPMLAKKLKLDPAVMAAPLITTIVDAASIFIYFTVATKFFNI
jgi:magnesium transporter